MSKRLFLTLIYGGAVVGLLMGFFHQVWWLFLPPLMFGTYFFGSTASVDAYRSEIYGGVQERPSMMSLMFLNNLVITAWNCVIQAVVFAAGWGASFLSS